MNGTKLRKPFQRDLCLDRLSDHAVRPVFINNEQGQNVISHLETPKQNHVGLKLWSYIGFLELRLVRI